MNKRQKSMKAYWATQKPEDRSKRASLAAKAKWKNMTKEQRKEHLDKMNHALRTSKKNNRNSKILK